MLLRKTITKDGINVLDKKKQVSSIIPNVVLSLDASHLTNLSIKLSEIFNIITVHNCFGCLPNNIPVLVEKVILLF